MRPIEKYIAIVLVCFVIATTFSFVACKKEEEVDNTVYYEVTFLDWDERIIQITKCKEGSSPLLPPIPTRDEDEDYTYIFSHWSKNLESVTEDMTVVAIYEATYIPKIFWMLDGEVYTKGLRYEFKYLPEVVDEDGYSHVVWYTEEEGGYKVTGFVLGGLSMDEDVFFYGRWEDIVEEDEE